MSSATMDRREMLLSGAAAGGWLASCAPAGSLSSNAPAPRLGRAFPSNFVWGTATAAYQIEGAAHEDGRGASVWDVFCRKPGAVFEGHSGDVACDHYHRYPEDVALLKKLGVKSYRLSVSWTRVLPQGAGAVNEKGLDFYGRLVDELLRAGIEPNVTLFHWDYPQALFEKGGWLARDSAAWFADYAALVVARLGDRVKVWVTHNEPNVVVSLGHLLGLHAPGLKSSIAEAALVSHNIMRAHAAAVPAIRAAAKGPVQVGYVIGLSVKHPASDAGGDLEAARGLMFAEQREWRFGNAWWLDPVLRGHYPQDALTMLGGDAPRELVADAPGLQQPIDFLGLNIYTSTPVRRGAGGSAEPAKAPPGYPRSAVDWQPIVPEAMYWGPRLVHERYQLPIFITENGLATRDQLYLDGKVHDPQRVDFIHRSLSELARAIADGVPVRGYYHWSLLDNFEWADGYKQRFGLVYVDYGSQTRAPKDSYGFYRSVIESNGQTVLGSTIVPVTKMTP